MKTVKIEELKRGDLIMVKWFDASELRARLNQHEKPEVAVCEWGIYLGVRGRRREYLLLGKEHVEGWNEWGAARIPTSLIEEIILLMPQAYQQTFPNMVLKKIKIRRSRHRVKVNI